MVDDVDYAGQRRAYISRVRDSFETEHAENGIELPGHETAGMRLRLMISVILFALFFIWYDSGTLIQGVGPGEVMDLIEYNRYDTILQEVLAAGETAVMGRR